MTRPTSLALVERALRRLPKKFKARIANIAVVVEDWAMPPTLAEMGIGAAGHVYGLYRGIDLTRRDTSYATSCPTS